MTSGQAHAVLKFQKQKYQIPNTKYQNIENDAYFREPSPKRFKFS